MTARRSATTIERIRFRPPVGGAGSGQRRRWSLHEARACDSVCAASPSPRACCGAEGSRRRATRGGEREMAKALIAAIAALVIVAVAAAAVARDDSPTAAAAPGGAVVMAAGDIATPGGARDLTAALLGPAGAVLTL